MHLLSSHLVETRCKLSNLEWLQAVKQRRSSLLNTRLQSLRGLESTELGKRDGLLNVLRRNLSGGDLLQGITDALGSSGNRLGLASHLDGEEAGIRVGVVLGRNLRARVGLGSLRQQREAGAPFDRGLAANKSSQDGDLGLVARSAVLRRAREGNHQAIASLVGDALLTAKVLGGSALLQLELADGSGAGVLAEELAHPLAQLSRVGAARDKSNVVFGVRRLGVVSNALGIQVAIERGGCDVVDRVAEPAVEGCRMGRVHGQRGRVRRISLLSQAQGLADNFAPLMACIVVRYFPVTVWENPNLLRYLV